MKTVVQALINWTPLEDGGRKHILPVGMRYCPIIVFEEEQTGDTLWSAEVYNTSVHDRVSSANVSYLSDEAPNYLLQSGKKFVLYEGQRVVAEGIVA
jgi:hypothetical protein